MSSYVEYMVGEIADCPFYPYDLFVYHLHQISNLTWDECEDVMDDALVEASARGVDCRYYDEWWM